MRTRWVTVNDRMQQGYDYLLTEPEGETSIPEFWPELTPAEMLQLGVFGGKYMTDCRDEFPADLVPRRQARPRRARPKAELFGVGASQPLAEWRRKGWIHDDDPRGWFQWYCRYYLGRRIAGRDERQIKRWRAIRATSPRSRPSAARRLCCHRRQRQALLHWAYDSRKI